MKRALIAAAVMAAVSGLLTTPDLVTDILAAITAFVLIFAVLFICLRFIPVASWSLAKQRTFTWLVAAGTGFSVVFMPFAIRLLTR